MSRSGYSDDCDDILAMGRWRAQVASSIRGRRGQEFFRELATAMDAMPEKVLISGDLVTPEGDCCAMGVVCKARGLDTTDIDVFSSQDVADLIGITHQLAAEIAYENDCSGETPEQRWVRMRAWVESNLKKAEDEHRS